MPHFDEALTLLRDRATDLYGMGRAFERLMQAAPVPGARHPGRPLYEGLAVARMAGPRRSRHGY